MNQQQILEEIQKARTILARYLEQNSRDPILNEIHLQLSLVGEEVEKTWPLPEEDLKQVILGRYAVRELEDDLPDLVMQLVRVDRLLKAALEIQNIP